MRKRFKLGAVCSADGSSGVYRASKRAHVAYLNKAHEDFTSSEMSKAFMALSSKRTEPLPDTMVRVKIFGQEKLLPYYRVKACGFTWSY